MDGNIVEEAPTAFFFYKQSPSDDLPAGTLGAILSVKQTGLGKDGLQRLIDRYGLP